VVARLALAAASIELERTAHLLPGPASDGASASAEPVVA
jgi:hypothetical protein